MDLWTGCSFGDPVDGGPIVVYCSRDTNGRRFNWPLPGGHAVQVHVCAEHSDTMARLCTTSVSDRIAARFEAELKPLLSELKSRGGYNCCGCSTYELIYEHALRIVNEEDSGFSHPGL